MASQSVTVELEASGRPVQIHPYVVVVDVVVHYSDGQASVEEPLAAAGHHLRGRYPGTDYAIGR